MSLNESIERLLNDRESMTLEEQNAVLRAWVAELDRKNSRLTAELSKAKQLAALIKHFSV